MCGGLTALAFSQSPGQVVGDTKLDLWVDPVGFLARALHMWEPQGFGGQVQNQAYGYFVPMGPVAVLGHLAGLPAWVVQRSWWALLLCAAFLGTVLLARRLRVGTPATVLVAGLAYALAPRMLTGLGATSIELVPMALAPWVLLPLVDAQRHGSARRAAALSGLAVLCVGGVNAVATAAVLPLPVLWLLTRPAGAFRRRLIGWWVLAVACATAWWAGPLLLLGRYGTPFLDYIETAATTTGPTDLLDVLRGTSHWVARLVDLGGPVWPAGFALVHDALPVLGTVVLAAAGLVALTRRDLPERPFLVLGVSAGVALVGLGHLATVQGALAGPLHEALDGVLAPLRNVHKFDPVLRLPLVLALAHLGAVLLRPGRPRAPRHRPAGPDRGRARLPAPGPVLAAALVLGLGASVLPAAAGSLARPAGFADLPAYWQQTADFLAGTADSGRALLVPASSFATYAWGTPGDEPLQPLARSGWEVRGAIPLADPAHIRVLDAVEQRLAAGRPSTGLAEFLGRAGISHVVLRNDLDAGRAGSARPVLVRRALLGSPGITPVAEFGPEFPGDTRLLGTTLDGGLAEPAPAVQVFAVDDVAPRAWTTPLSQVATVTGGPDALLPLADRGVLGDAATVLAGTPVAAAGPVLVSDALQRRERGFGRIAGAVSAALSADDPLRLQGPEPDYQVSDPAAATSVVEYTGATPSASGSASDPGQLGGAVPAAQPWSAVDDDPATAWRPDDAGRAGGTAWWQLTTDRPVAVSSVTVQRAPEPAPSGPVRVTVTTDTGSRDVDLAATSDPQVVEVPAGTSRTLRITARDASALALAEVVVPGVTVERSVVVPAPAGPADVYAFDAGQGSAGCVLDGAGTARCAPDLVVGAEEPAGLDRTFTVVGTAEHDLVLTARPRPGPALDRLLTGAGGGGYGVLATSSSVPDPRGSAVAAVDGDPTTSWLAAPGDRRPGLVLTWSAPQEVDSVRVVLPPAGASSRPTAVEVDTGGLPALLPLPEDGVVTFPAVTTDRLSLRFELPIPQSSYDPYTATGATLPVGIAEVEVAGVAPPRDDTVVALPCGQGPPVVLDGRTTGTSARTTVGDLRGLRPVVLTPCGAAQVPLEAGRHRITAGATDLLVTSSATLTRTGGGGAAATVVGRTPATVLDWEAEHRAVRVPVRAVDTLLVVPENVNRGWVATVEGQQLAATVVDGWQQAWVVPAGRGGEVVLTFAPGPVYRAALLAGAGAVALLALLLALPVRDRRAGQRVPVPRGGSRSSAVVVLGVVAGAVLAAGWVGALGLAGSVALRSVVGRDGERVLGAVAGGAVSVAGALLLIHPDGTGTAQQVLVALALAAVGAAVLPVPAARRRTT